MTRTHRIVALLFVAAALVVLGGTLSPGHREGVGVLLMIGAYPLWMGWEIVKGKRR